MYQALLTRRYLTSKVMPLLAAVAVTLCVAMELIVWSVMGGFLVMLVESGRTLIGDVAISYPTTGFAYYEDLIKRLEADPAVEAAAPMIESFGLVSMPMGGAPDTVVVKGVDSRMDRVTGFAGTLWWKPLDKPVAKDSERQDPRLDPEIRGHLAQAHRNGLALSVPDPAGGPDRPAMVTGTEVGGYNTRADGGYLIPWPQDGNPFPFLLRAPKPATLAVMPMDLSGHALLEQKTMVFPIANQFRSNLYEIDANTIFLRMDALQSMLRMGEMKRTLPGKTVERVVLPDGTEEFQRPMATITQPARVTTVLVRAKPGTDAVLLKERCAAVYADFATAHAGDVLPPPENIYIRTWRERNKTLIDAVENETGLVMFIFGIISVTSVFLVLAIFWSMVSEKTKDIGVLRAIGASRGGVAWIWLRYGLAIGVVGAVLGGVIAYLIVTNINPIHDWLGRNLHIVIWNPKVYYFTTIPHTVEWGKAAIVMVSGVVASVAGALVPALKAANMDPVKALRFE